MKLSNSRKPVAFLAGSAFVTTFGLAGLAQADDQTLFVANDLDSGYLLAKGDDEGTCGEGKCGEGSCGEGKGAHTHPAGVEGKCGEGKCGEGSCGEGKGAHVHSGDDSQQG